MSSFAHFMMVLAGLSFFAFALTHVDQHKELDFAWPVFVDEMALALGLTLVYVVESLVVGETPIDFDEPAAMNLHYSSRRITVLALAVLLGGGIIVWYQTTGRDVPTWIIAGPLLLLKHLFDQKALRDRTEDRRNLAL